jgi:hypothetical protein
METKYISETSMGFERTTMRYIPYGINLHNHRCENLKSHKDIRPKYFSYYALLG